MIVGDVVSTMTDEQKQIMYLLVGLAIQKEHTSSDDNLIRITNALNSMTNAQKKVTYGLVGLADESKGHRWIDDSKNYISIGIGFCNTVGAKSMSIEGDI